MSEKIRVLVVDDSALMRKLIPQTLLNDPKIEVVGTAMDGLIGLRKIEELRPHVVTLDLEMPRMDGIEMLRQITRKHRVPVIVVSAHTEEGASLTIKALSLGAFDFVTKPQDAASGRLAQIASELALKIKVAAASGAPKMIITLPTARRKESVRSPCSRAGRRAWWPSAFPPEVRTRCNISFRSSPRISRVAFLSSSTCPKASPKCLPGA